MVVLGTTYYTDCTYRHHLAAITMVCVISRGGSRNCEGGGLVTMRSNVPS